MSRRVKIAIIFVVVVVGGYAAANLINGSAGVPAEFTDARLQGALIAQNIVRLSNESAADIQEINDFDRSGNVTEALDLTSNVIAKSQDLRQQAVALSTEIERMTRSLSTVKPAAAREIALTSISDRLILISKLVNYSALLGQLADALRGRFLGTPTEFKVSAVIEKINAEVDSINGLDKKATEAMERFDELVK